MPVSEAQRKASVKYLEKLDEIRIRMPKGRKAEIQAHAQTKGESVNSFIIRSISEAMARDSAPAPPCSDAPRGGAEDSNAIQIKEV